VTAKGATSAHPRVCVSGLCFPELSALDALEAIADLGAANASMTGAKVRESGAEAVAAASRRLGVKVVTTTGALGLDLSSGQASGASLRRARQDIDLAAAVGAGAMYGLVGPRTSARWDASADAYVNAVGELVDYAADRGLTLAIEPASWLYADLTFIHSFHDAIAVAPRAGMGICLDAFHVWTEAGLREEISEHIGLIAHVQLSDMVRGSRSLPCRAVPGDGDVPIAAVVQWLLEAGYGGVFDCELNGPAIDAIGHHVAASQTAGWLDTLLKELGA
jgi:sugar phosphate isomerase/epimerase